MYDLLRAELEKKDAFSTKMPKFFTDLAKSIPNTRVSDKMKLTIAVSEFILFASQFRRNILHWNTSSIPINAITFCITGSGVGKDSSINAMRKNYRLGYEFINSVREGKAIEAAIRSAKNKNLAKADTPEVYSKFYSPPIPLFAAPSTVEGYIAYLNEIDEDGIGAGFITSSEFGSELLVSPVITSNLQLLSEMYDEGKKEVKVIKDKERQSKEIKNLPVSALFVGSPDNILFDDTVKRKFKIEFSSKLARRSFFNYNVEIPPQKEYNKISEMIADEIALEDTAREIITAYENIFLDIAKKQYEKRKIPLTVSRETIALFTTYRRYNVEASDMIKKQYPISKIVRAHMQWKALKLSGAIAIFKDHDTITEEDYLEAIRFCEVLNEDMMNFEIELVKEPYELFVSLVQQLLENNKCFVNIHLLKKLGYIQGSSNISQRLKELATLAGSYDESGVYKAVENGIEYSKIIKTNALGVSYLECSGTKEERQSKCANGYSYAEVDFKALGDMLLKDYAYSPFKFKNGIRGKANIEGGTKWIALDVDKSIFTDEQTHLILQNFNHHIVRTSNQNNPNKFRVLLELDSFVDLDDRTYKAFIESIAEYLSLDIDPLPKSQIFFSYAGRKVYSVTDKEPIEVRLHLINANNETKPKVPLDSLSDPQKKALLSSPFDTFRYAFEANQGEGSISLIRAAKHAKDLGMDKEGILNLMEEINSYWEEPMEQTRFENTILNQIRNWSM